MDRLLSRKRYIILFMGIPLALFAVFGVFPIVYNLYLSLFDTNLLVEGTFVGLDNFVRLFKDRFFQKVLENNIRFLIFTYIAHMGIAILLANLLFGKVKGSRFYQCIFFLPSVICGTAIGLLWKFVYHPEFGVVNNFLELIGLGNLTTNWLADKNTVVPCLIIAVMWQYVGYHMSIQLAAMRGIDSNILEAAQMDGANGWTRLTKITLPLIKPVLQVDSVLILTSALGIYDIISVTTTGGPNHASEVLSLNIYKEAFTNHNFGYASAISAVQLALCLLVTVIVKRVFREKE